MDRSVNESQVLYLSRPQVLGDQRFFLSVALKISHFVKATVVFGTGEMHYH